jgi:hypothetical protein
MLQTELREGMRYGFREKPRSRAPFIEVQLLQKVGRKGHVQVKYLSGPHPGLVEHVKTQQLVVPWGKHKAFLRDEQRLDAIRDHSSKHAREPYLNAITTVFEATGYPEAATDSRGVLSTDRASLSLMIDRAGLEVEGSDLHPLAFEDHHGIVHVPYEGAEVLARALAAREASAVSLYLDDLEARYRAEGFQPGERSSHDFLREQMPGFALARQWAGIDHALDAQREEIERLRRLVMSAIWDFEKLGHDRQTNRLRRGLEGR